MQTLGSQCRIAGVAESAADLEMSGYSGPGAERRRNGRPGGASLRAFRIGAGAPGTDPSLCCAEDERLHIASERLAG